MPADTILRRSRDGVFEMLVEVKPGDAVAPAGDLYVPRFHRQTDELERDAWTWEHSRFIDNVYESITDHLQTLAGDDVGAGVEVDFCKLRRAVADYVFDHTVHARGKNVA
jgi:hypothetical protein